MHIYNCLQVLIRHLMDIKSTVKCISISPFTDLKNDIAKAVTVPDTPAVLPEF